MTTTRDSELSRELLERPVTGLRLDGATLGDLVASGPTLLSFLRHFG